MRRDSTGIGVSTIIVAVIVVVIVVLSSLGAYFVINYKQTPSSQDRYLLTFDQIPLCQSPSQSLYNQIFIPWYVTLSNGVNSTTKVQPANSSSLPNPNNGVGGAPNNSTQYATITFYVRNGQYNYTLGPPNYYYVNRTSSSGLVTIDGNNATVDFSLRLASCGSSVTTTTKTSG